MRRQRLCNSQSVRNLLLIVLRLNDSLMLTEGIVSLHPRQAAQGCLHRNQQNNPSYPCVTHEAYKYMQCGMKKMSMNTYYDNVPKEENTTLCFPSFKNWNGMQKLVATMPNDQALREWERQTFKDMRWNDNHQHPIKYWSRDVFKSTRWLMQQRAYAKHLIYAPQCCFNSDHPPKCLYTEMHTEHWW